MSKAVFFFAPGLEECEGLVTVDLLRRAGVEVTIASITEDPMILGAHNIAVRCDALASALELSSFDAVVLPGGMPGTEHLYECETVRKTVLDYAAAGKTVAAICAAPTVLGRLGLLEGKRATCYPGCEDQLTGAAYVDAETVTDGNLITGSGLGAAIPFALTIIAALEGAECADRVRRSIIYRH